jgi:hypothetical protein
MMMRGHVKKFWSSAAFMAALVVAGFVFFSCTEKPSQPSEAFDKLAGRV